MGLKYYIDGSLPQNVVAELVVMFERLFERCPSDSRLSFNLLSPSPDNFSLEVSLSSANMRFRESLEGSSIMSVKRGLKNIFKSRIEGWRRDSNS